MPYQTPNRHSKAIDSSTHSSTGNRHALQLLYHNPVKSPAHHRRSRFVPVSTIAPYPTSAARSGCFSFWSRRIRTIAADTPIVKAKIGSAILVS